MDNPENNTMWTLLEKVVDAERCKHFMFMGMYAINTGKPLLDCADRETPTVHAYKHRDTRRYLNIDKNGDCFIYDGKRYLALPTEQAMGHVFG